jgi:hypothetical protein
MAAWVLAFREPVAQRPARSSIVSQLPAPAGLHAELTLILTAMALGNERMTA